MKEYLNGLNEEQLEAATTINGPVLIIAGAGTGKTHTLISRTACILDSGVNPENILLVTFTKKAAEEMKTRLCSYKEISNGNKIITGTFHSICDRILRKHAAKLSLNNNYTIIDQADCKDIIGIFTAEIKERYKVEASFFQGKEKKDIDSFPSNALILAAHSRWINNMTRAEDEIESDPEIFDEFNKDVLSILKSYDEYKKEKNLMDFDDLLLYTYELLSKFDLVRRFYDNQFKYIMCDEYQDTNVIQDAILDLLAKDNDNLSVVGDDNQSIYKFRGARIENILTFEERHVGCKVVKLVQNYRSTQEILDMANAVMSHAVEGIRKDLIGQKNGTKPKMVVSYTETSQAEYISKIIQKKHAEGLPYKQICVIVRGTAQSTFIEANLLRNKISFVKYGGVGFFQKTIVKDVLSYIRASLSDKDEIAWLRMLKLHPGIGSAAAKTTAEYIAQNGYEKAKTLNYSSRVQSSMDNVFETIDNIKQKKPYEQLDYIINNKYKELRKELCKKKKSENARKVEEENINNDINDLQMLIELSKEYITTRQMIDDFVLNVPEKKSEKDVVVISTIHSVKGLEYDTVFLVDPVQGIFPRTEDDYEDDDKEDRRCLYVALTRAKNDLYICIPKMAMKYGKPTDGILSHHLSYEDIIETTMHHDAIYEMFYEEGTKSRTYGEWF